MHQRRLALAGGANSKRVVYIFRDVFYGDLYWHDGLVLIEIWLFRLFHQLCKLIEEIIGIVRAGGGFGVVLDGEGG